RAFLENTVTQVIAFEGQGKLSEFGGGYDDWLRYSQQQAQAVSAGAITKPPQAPAPASQPAAPAPRKKLSFKEQKELESLPAEIETLEQEQAEIQHQFSQGDIYRQAPEQVKQLQNRLDEIEALVLEKLTRWEQLESLLG
ncbi:MAG TPA: ABC transporter ATP-binding protein, partial [Methylophilus sp.]